MMTSRTVPDITDTRQYSSVSRSRSGMPSRQPAPAWSDPVSGAGDGLDQRRVAELRPQPVHRRLHRGGERVGRLVPDPVQQLLGRTPPGRRRSAGIRARRTPSGSAAAGAPARVAIRCAGSRRRSPCTRTGGAAGWDAPADRADPGHQLGVGERLGQVVVGAQTEPFDPARDGARGGQHQHAAREPPATSARHTSSPWTPGRSRSSTTTS